SAAGRSRAGYSRSKFRRASGPNWKTEFTTEARRARRRQEGRNENDRYSFLFFLRVLRASVVNPPMDYLPQLTARLADGLARPPHARRDPHVRYLRARQNADGGWPGREGGSDLYYTAFALRGLAVLGDLTPDVAERAGGFLRSCLNRQAGVVDFFSLLYA